MSGEETNTPYWKCHRCGHEDRSQKNPISFYHTVQVENCPKCNEASMRAIGVRVVGCKVLKYGTEVEAPHAQ